ncbi:phosphoribosyl-ATP diphosphatase [Candidatus Sumerlaeota bacterium]|nr:phosphoribosyl-ATP diphosphatase [Candidatus Sumerlaeota bacterium]HNM46267.1 phosphoribosyl-ATP diphosphatase [Candidatus Sumerlaeota bacterium]
MIIPSIDIMGGQVVQLVGGKEETLKKDTQYGNPLPLAERFRLAGEIAVIDLDSALGKGSNKDLIKSLLRVADCRVGGGIRSLEVAMEWLDAGAKRIIIGTAAKPELLKQLPRERLIAALDAYDGDVVVEGWTKKTGASIVDRVRELKDYVGGFLVTFVEKEGRMGGTNMDRVAEIVEAAGSARVTIAGGVTTLEELAQLDKLNADAQVGMAIYTGRMDFGDAVAAPLTSDRPDGLIPTVVCDENGVALGLAYSSKESIREAVNKRAGIYQSRKRGLWVKGGSSGATQELLRVTPDCDRDAVRFIVRQNPPGYCHLPQWTCFGETGGLTELMRTMEERRKNAPAGSYTRRLLNDAELLKAKLTEEAGELASATAKDDVAWEAADVIYFTAVAMARAGVTLADVERHLDLRARKLTRRKGDAKPQA